MAFVLPDDTDMKALLPFVLGLEMLASPAWAALKLSCDTDYGGKAYRIVAQPTDDVFAFQSVDAGTRFRFSIQWLPSRAKLKTFVHELDERAPVLIHAAEYPLPASGCPARPLDFGLNKVYSSDLGRELFFQCSASCE